MFRAAEYYFSNDIVSIFFKDKDSMLLHLSKHFSILRLKNVIADEGFAHMFTNNSAGHQVNL